MYEIILIAILCFSVRALPGLLSISPTGSDQWYHLFFADYIRKNKFKYPKTLKEFLLPGIYDYPPLYHYLLALFPRGFREMVCKYIGACIDTLSLIVIYYSILYLSEFPELSDHFSHPILTAYIACLLFALHPAFLALGGGPRAYSATPRPLGELFLSLSLLFLLFHFVDSSIMMIFLASFFVALNLLTSKFGAQVLLFFFPIIGILMQSLLLFFVPLLGLALGIILSKGHVLRVLYGSYRYSVLYRNVIQERFDFTLGRNNLQDIKDCLKFVWRGKISLFIRSFYSKIIMHNTWAILFIRNPILPVIFFIIYYNYNLIVTNGTSFFLITWIIASLIIFVMTSLKPFLFLGEAERYLEYSIPAQVIIMALYFNFWSSYYYLVLIYFLVFYGATLLMLYRANRSQKNYIAVKDDSFNWIKDNITKKNFLSIPSSGGQYELLYKTGNSIFATPGNMSLLRKEDIEIIYPKRFYYPNENFDTLIFKYSIDYILVDRLVFKRNSEIQFTYNFEKYSKIFENSQFLIYNVE